MPKVQYLVSTVDGDALPDISSVERHFREYASIMRVEAREEGFLVSLIERVLHHEPALSTAIWNLKVILLPAREKRHTVDGQQMRVDLLHPEVYGCQVDVTQGHVLISLGKCVIESLRRDERWHNQFFQTLRPQLGDTVRLRWGGDGCLAVTLVSAACPHQKWLWEFLILDSLIRMLRPFESLLPAAPRSIRDRCIVEDRTKLQQPPSPPGSDDRPTDAVFQFKKSYYDIVASRVLLQKIQDRYPGLKLSSDADSGTVRVSGGADDVDKATQDFSNCLGNLSEKEVQVSDIQTKMLVSPGARGWLQRSFDGKGVSCTWELKFHTTVNPPTTSLFRSLRSRSTQTTAVVSITAPTPDLETVVEIVQSCFPTTEIRLIRNQIPVLQSDSWKAFLDGLQRPNEDGLEPLVKIHQDSIVICDTVSAIESTRRAVMDFFYQSMIHSHKEFCQQEVKTVISGLQQWQLQLLTKPQVFKQLPACLEHNLSINMENSCVSILAPLHINDKCVAAFWRHIAHFSQTTIAVTAASTDMLQMPESRERVQSLLDEEGIACDWHVQQETLVINAHRSHIQQLERIFMAEIERQPSSEQKKDKEAETEDRKAGTDDKQQQTETKNSQNTGQQTDSIDKEDKEVQLETGRQEKGTQTEEDSVLTDCKQTQAGGIHLQQNKGTQTAETAETDTQTDDANLTHIDDHPGHRIDQMGENPPNDVGKPCQGRPSGSRQPLTQDPGLENEQMQESKRGDDLPETTATMKPNPPLTKDPRSQPVSGEVRRIHTQSQKQTVQQRTDELTVGTLGNQETNGPSRQMTRDAGDPPQPDRTSSEQSSRMDPTAVIDSQADHGDGPVTISASPSNLYALRLSETPDFSPSPSTCRHRPRSSFTSAESQKTNPADRRRANNDVNSTTTTYSDDSSSVLGITDTSDSNLSTTSDSNLSTTSDSNLSTTSDSNLSTTSDSNLSTTSDSNLSTTSDSNLSTTSDSNLSTTSDSNLSTTSDSDLSTTSDSNLSTTSDSNLSTTSDSNLSTTSDSNLSTTFDSNLSTTSDSNLSTTSDSNLSTIPDSNLSTTSDSNLSTTSDSNLSTTSDSNLSTTSDSNLSTTSDSNLSTTSDSNLSTTSDSDGVHPEQVHQHDASSRNRTAARDQRRYQDTRIQESSNSYFVMPEMEGLPERRTGQSTRIVYSPASQCFECYWGTHARASPEAFSGTPGNGEVQPSQAFLSIRLSPHSFLYMAGQTRTNPPAVQQRHQRSEQQHEQRQQKRQQEPQQRQEQEP